MRLVAFPGHAGHRQMHFIIPRSHLILAAPGCCPGIITDGKREKLHTQNAGGCCSFGTSSSPQIRTCLSILLSIHPTHSWTWTNMTGLAVVSLLWDNSHSRIIPHFSFHLPTSAHSQSFPNSLKENLVAGVGSENLKQRKKYPNARLVPILNNILRYIILHIYNILKYYRNIYI